MGKVEEVQEEVMKEMSQEEYPQLLISIFKDKFQEHFPKGTFRVAVQNQGISFTLSLNGEEDFTITSSGDLVETIFRESYINTQFTQYLEEDFGDVVSDILTWIDKFYCREAEIIKYQTRILKKRKVLLKDTTSGDVLYFNHLGA